MTKFLTILLMVLMAVHCEAALKTQTIEYRESATTLEGYLATDDTFKGPRPAVIIVHDWMGLGKFAKAKADQLAQMGYVAFAADIYGKGVRPHSPAEAMDQVKKYKGDRQLLRARVLAAFDLIRGREDVDAKRIAAIGYCFGGTTVLELARSGAPVAGVVSFHGGLDSPTPADAANIKGKVLVLHGADDPYESTAEIAAFEDEMRKGHVDWQFIKYSGAVHAFTNPDAGTDNSKGAAYNERADKRSWEAMKQFFAEVFQ